MNEASILDHNARAQKKPEMVLHHVEIHPESNKKGALVKGGGHTVHTIMRDKDDQYGRHAEAEKPFGAGQHEEMLAHVANELHLPTGQEGDEGFAAGAAD